MLHNSLTNSHADYGMNVLQCDFLFLLQAGNMPGQGIGTFEEDADCSIDLLLKICVLVGSFLLRVSDGMISVYFFAQNSWKWGFVHWILFLICVSDDEWRIGLLDLCIEMSTMYDFICKRHWRLKYHHQKEKKVLVGDHHQYYCSIVVGLRRCRRWFIHSFIRSINQSIDQSINQSNTYRRGSLPAAVNRVLKQINQPALQEALDWNTCNIII